MQHLTLVPSASQFLFRERPSHSYSASLPFALPLTKKERKSMKPRINRTPPLPSPSAPFLKDDVKFNSENSSILTLILPSNRCYLLGANLHWKWTKTKLKLNAWCCFEVYSPDTIPCSRIIHFCSLCIKFTFQIYHPRNHLRPLTCCPEGLMLSHKRTGCRINWMFGT